MHGSGRETFSSTWGTVLTTAGVAIGLGNIWRFPYMMGAFGGATFLLLYLLIVILFGVPGLMAEWALGRHTRRGPPGAFEQAGVAGGRGWGYLLLLTVTMAGSYYAVVVAWVLCYGAGFALGLGGWSEGGLEILRGSSGAQWLGLILTLAAAFGALHLGVQRGIERLSRWILPLFFLLFAVLLVRTLTLEGAGEGLAYLLTPRWDDLKAGTLLGALGQAYFSLALGGTFMLVYGSYLDEEEDIPRGAVMTSMTDVAASLLAALVVVPAVFALGLNMADGPALMFDVMPGVFAGLPAGGLFGALFFFSVFIVALLSLIAAYEVIVAACQDQWGWRREKGIALLFPLQLILAVPALMSMDYLFYSDLLWGSTMQPLGGALAVVALTWFVGRGAALQELRRNTRLHLPDWLFYWIRYAIPAGIVVILIYGWTGG